MNYIASLIAAAVEDGQKPVLTFCRSLGRVGAIKQHFGGWHIFLYRNLFRQWMSYLGQYYSGSAYFLSATHRAITLSQHDPFFAVLAKRYISGDGDFGGFTDIERAFGGFVGLHLYLSMKAFAVADQVIEADRLPKTLITLSRPIRRLRRKRVLSSIDRRAEVDRKCGCKAELPREEFN